MDSQVLKKLNPRATRSLSRETYAQDSMPDLSSYEEVLSREIGLESLDAVIDEGMNLEKVASDAWLAPRVHAALPMTRSEAGDRGIWLFLANRHREYVRWRWLNQKGTITQERITGGNSRQALARLWWAAELTRNGKDYGTVSNAFHNSDVALWLLDVDAFHNRAVALAFTEYVSTRKRNNEDSKKLAKTLNFSAKTIPIDVIAPDPGPDAIALALWLEAVPDKTLMRGDRLPEGPNDAPVARDSIEALLEIIGRFDIGASAAAK